MSAAPPPSYARRRRVALALLAPLLAAVLGLAAFAPWRSNMSVDNRTYLEMIDGVARHGLPYTDNGPAERFAELQAEWNYQRGGRLWGTYPPVFPYVAAPVYRLGGVTAVMKLNVALLALVALGTFALAARLLGDPRLGTAAAYVSLLAAPIWAITFDTSSYTLAIAGVVWSVYFALAALKQPGRRGVRAAALAGLVGALATGTHLFAFPVLATIVALLFVLRADGDADADAAEAPAPPRAAWRARLGAWLPTRASLRRGSWALIGAAPPLALVSALNRVRFGTFNPVTYGPCPWRTCAESGAANQNPAAMLAFAAPVLAYLAAVALALALVWRSRAARVAVVAAAVLVLAPESELHRRAFLFLAVASSYLVDVSQMTLRLPYVRHADGLGQLFGPFVLKSVLQGTPALALAALVPAATPGARREVALLALPCAALLGLLVLRANMPSEHAVGVSWLHFRYMMPAVPMLVALALGAARTLPLRGWHLGLLVALALALGAWLWQWDDDLAYPRRFFLLRATLAVAALAFVLAARARTSPRPAWGHAAAAGLVVALACGVATTNAVDLRTVLRHRREHDARLDAVARATPARFALVGWTAELNPVLALKVTRDVEYADLWQREGWDGFYALLARWERERRPVFALLPPHLAAEPPWPDLRLEPVDPDSGLYRLLRR